MIRMTPKTRRLLGVMLAAGGVVLLVQGTISLSRMAGKAIRYQELLNPHLIQVSGVFTTSSGEESERRLSVTLPSATVNELRSIGPHGTNRNVVLACMAAGVGMLLAGTRLQDQSRTRPHR